MENSNSNANVTKTAKALNIAAIVLCVILLPILCFNCILLVKGMINADEVPSVGKYIPLIVETDSMEDTIMTGDLIFIKKVDVNDLDVDDVITFYNPLGDGTSLVTHRIIKVINDENGLSFLTQGDNNDMDDDTNFKGTKLYSFADSNERLYRVAEDREPYGKKD